MSQVEDGPGCAEGRWALDFLFRGNGQNSSQPLLWRWGTEDADLLFSFTRPWDLKDKRLYKIEEGTTHLVENLLLFSFGNNHKKKVSKFVSSFVCLFCSFVLKRSGQRAEAHSMRHLDSTSPMRTPPPLPVCDWMSNWSCSSSCF